jgi:cob(I)alamin adenosyltransferase
METEQMMAHLLARMKAEIRTNQAKTDANLKEMKEEMMARLEAKVEANNEKVKPIQEKVVCNHEELMAIIKPVKKGWKPIRKN